MTVRVEKTEQLFLPVQGFPKGRVIDVMRRLNYRGPKCVARDHSAHMQYPYCS